MHAHTRSKNKYFKEVKVRVRVRVTEGLTSPRPIYADISQFLCSDNIHIHLLLSEILNINPNISPSSHFSYTTQYEQVS